MVELIIHVLKHTIMITGFVFVMMLVIEYINVQTNGIWQKIILNHNWKQYIFSALLGIIPGCLGAFTVVAMYSHRLISLGAIVAAMIATSGDEAFVMFAMFPQKALLLTFIIFVVGIFAGYVTDKFYKPEKLLKKFDLHSFPLHTDVQCKCFQKEKFFNQILKPTVYRFILVFIVLFLLILILSGLLAANSALWIKITLILAVSFSLFIVISVPDHFLNKHLWEHIVKKHLPNIFLWTFGTLLIFAVLMKFVNINDWLNDNMLSVLIIAVLVGIIPESGPHLIFVTLFAQGAIPFSVLIASSISQDGHGMLPLLAESKRGFITVKIINVIVAIIFGLLIYFIGY